MTTSFGPQSPNYTTTRPATDTNVSGVTDTWFKDCSSATAVDGTVPTASWYNMVTANLREAVRGSGIALDDSDNMLFNAITAIAQGAYTASNGVKLVGNDFQLDLGGGTLPVMTP